MGTRGASGRDVGMDILCFLSSANRAGEYPTALELSNSLHVAVATVRTHLNRLIERDLVAERKGLHLTGGRRWLITAKGRENIAPRAVVRKHHTTTDAAGSIMVFLLGMGERNVRPSKAGIVNGTRVSPNAVDRHLKKFMAEGLVESERERLGRSWCATYALTADGRLAAINVAARKATA